MNRAVMLVAGLILIIGFQNCAQQSPNALQQANFQSQDSSADVEKIYPDGDLSRVDTIEIPIRYQDENSTARAKLLREGHLLVSMRNGIIMAVDDGGQKMNEHDHCISDDDRVELRSILSRANVCRKKLAGEDGMVCAQVIKSPYASLYKSDEKIDLGKDTDSCGLKALELCGEGSLREDFLALITKVKSNWSSSSCVSGS